MGIDSSAPELDAKISYLENTLHLYHKTAGQLLNTDEQRSNASIEHYHQTHGTFQTAETQDEIQGLDKTIHRYSDKIRQLDPAQRRLSPKYAPIQLELTKLLAEQESESQLKGTLRHELTELKGEVAHILAKECIEEHYEEGDLSDEEWHDLEVFAATMLMDYMGM